MTYEIITTERFENDVAYYLKKKKYRHIIDDISTIVDELENGNLLGDVVPEVSPNDNKSIKVRIANTDTNSGKSNGYRMIYYVVKDDAEIYW